MSTLAYIQEHAAAAYQATSGTPINMATVLAIGALESGNGASQLASRYNNHFGIKGTGPGGSVTLPTREYRNGRYVTVNEPFRVYSTYEQGVNDLIAVLTQNSRYAAAMPYKSNPLAQLNEIWKAGYATDPAYISKVAPIVKAAEQFQQLSNYSYNPLTLLVISAGIYYLVNHGSQSNKTASK